MSLLGITQFLWHWAYKLSHKSAFAESDNWFNSHVYVPSLRAAAVLLIAKLEIETGTFCIESVFSFSIKWMLCNIVSNVQFLKEGFGFFGLIYNSHKPAQKYSHKVCFKTQCGRIPLYKMQSAKITPIKTFSFLPLVKLLTVTPENNCLALVYRDRETLKFVKYINRHSLEQTASHPAGTEFWDFCFVYSEWLIAQS